MAYEKLYTVIGFENRPSRKALLSAENLNKMDSAINELDDRIIEMSKATTPVTNFLTTEPGSPLDATMGKELNDKIEALGGFIPVIDETTGKITGYKTRAGADTVFPFKSVVHCGSYTENGSFDVTTFGLSNVKRKNFIFVPTLAQTWVYGIATKIPYTNYEYARGFGGYKPHTFALSGNILTFTLPICTGSAYCGPTASNASAEVGEAYTLPIAGDIYYIG